MKKFAFKSIKTRLIFWFLCIALIPLIISIFITYTQRVNSIKIRSFDKLTAIRDLKVNLLDSWLVERKRDIRILSKNLEGNYLENISSKKNLDQNDQRILEIRRSLLNRFLNNNPSYNELFIINSNTGVIQISTIPNFELIDKSDDLYFTKPMQTGELFIKDIYYSKSTQKHAMTFSIPVFCTEHDSSHITGILVARVDLTNSLYKMLMDRVGLGETGETLIVNKNVVALSNLRWYANAPLNLKIKAQPAINAAQGKTGITVTADYRGEKVLAAYTYIPETEWGFICKQDLYELHAPIREMVLNFVLLFLTFTLIIYLVALFVSKNISEPIISLDSLSKKIKAGDFSVRSVINSQDELGSLSESVNAMTASIESRITVQKSVNDISKTLIGYLTKEKFASVLLKKLIEITGSNMGAFYTFNELTSEFENLTSIGANEKLLKSFNTEASEGRFSNELLKKHIFYMRDVQESTIFKFQTTVDNKILKEISTIPIIIDDIIMAIISLASIRNFDKECKDILEQSWLSINSHFVGLLAYGKAKLMAENIETYNQQLEEKKTTLEKSQQSLALLLEDVNEVRTELNTANKELKASNKEMEAFSYSVSHDLRAPLRHIGGFTSLLNKNIKNKIDEKSQNYIDNIISSSKQMNKLIDDLLIFSRMGRKNVNKTKINMKTVVDEAIELFESDIKENNISIIIDDMPEVNVDSSLMEQVWINLISNAIKFTGSKKRPKIHIGIDKDSDANTIFFIKDNGVGFDQKYVGKIFGVFQRLHTIDEFPGTGIGLANVKRIILKHGGDIRAEGKINKGASFFFTLHNV